MKLDELATRLDALESPSAKLLRCARQLIDHEFRGLTEDQRNRFSAGPVRELTSSALPAFEKYNYAGFDKHLVDFQFALRRVLQHEQQHGELKQHTPESEIEDHHQALTARLYKGMELDAIRHLLKPGEKIVTVDWRSIETDQQVIRRSELPKVCRPVTFRDGNKWRSQFVSDAKVEEAIEAERGRNNPSPRGSGPSAWIE